MIEKPVKGTRKAQQHARFAARASERARLERAAGFRPKGPRPKIRKAGKYTIRQNGFNQRVRGLWEAALHEVTPCVWAPREPQDPAAGYEAGHIEGKDVRPELRFALRDLAPISPLANTLMKYDVAFRRKAQRKMRAWVRAAMPLLEAHLAHKGAVHSGLILGASPRGGSAV